MTIILMSCFSNVLYSQETADQYFDSGKQKLQLKDITGAVKDFTAAIKLNPEHELAYVNRAICRMSLGQWKQAIPDCTSAIRLNPNQAVGYFIRGCAKGNTKTNGCDDLRKSVELGYAQASMALSRYCK